MRRGFYALAAGVICAMAPWVVVSGRVLHTKADKIVTLFDGGKAQERRVVPSAKPEELVTTAAELTFQSDIDTLTVRLDEWQSEPLTIVNAAGDSAYINIRRHAANRYENPSPEILALAPSGLLSRAQAEFDIDALINAISNVHPDMFSQCRHVDFFQAVKELKQSLPDSVSAAELYLGLTPIVAMLGDGHTHLLMPEDRVMTEAAPYMPLYLRATPERSLKAVWCSGGAVPTGAEIVAINGVSADSIIRSMLPLESGERDHFKMMRINYDFAGLFHLMYPADKYVISYRKEGDKAVKKATLQPQPWAAIKSHFKEEETRDEADPYTFTIDQARNVAIMDFRSFVDQARMEQFADSMFRELRDKRIGNLIIDLRNNGGGNSMVGDVLLRYIAPEPFTQMDKVLVRVTPLTARLLNARYLPAMIQLIEIPESEYIRPRSKEDGFYDGNVYLLTSSKTFSSAASFAWTFGECKIGPIIGEETGGMNVSYGDKVWYTLPVSGLECGISFKRFWQFRADESSIHGAMPDIPVAAPEALTRALSLLPPR